MKPERWGSLLVQENYREEKACDKRYNDDDDDYDDDDDDDNNNNSNNNNVTKFPKKCLAMCPSTLPATACSSQNIWTHSLPSAEYLKFTPVNHYSSLLKQVIKQARCGTLTNICLPQKTYQQNL